MFSIDFPEIVIIFGIALVVLGPKKLPGAAAQIGRWVGRARAMARQFREQLEQEVGSVESSLDLKKAMESSTTESKGTAPVASGSAEPRPASTEESAVVTEDTADAEHAVDTEHAATEYATAAEQPDVALEAEPQWPESAGGWSPDSLIAASMPSSEPGAPHAEAGPEPAPVHPSVHTCVSAGGGAPGTARVRVVANGEPAAHSEPAAHDEPAVIEHGGR